MTMQYVDTGKDRPGGSDARFWKQYLSEDEGDPLFGFAQQESNKSFLIKQAINLDKGKENADWIKKADGGKSQKKELAIHDKLEAKHDKGVAAVKGGEGSGNFGHAGRPGERGGSAPVNSGSGTTLSMAEVDSNSRAFEQDLKDKNYENNPIIKAWIGGESDPEHYVTALDIRSPQYKDKVVQSLADEIGISYNDANAFIRAWANSSNEGLAASLIQDAASEEFGIPISEWQKDKNSQNLDDWRWELNYYFDTIKNMEKLDGNDEKKIIELGLAQFPFPEKVKDSLDKIWKESVKKAQFKRGALSSSKIDALIEKIDKAINQARDENKPVIKKALRWMYNKTQEDLASLGISEIILYRGVKSAEAAQVDKGQTVPIVTNALSSWTAYKEVSHQFAANFESSDGAAFAMKVPVSRVLSTPRTGFGCLSEFEFVLLGGLGDKAIAVYTPGKPTLF